ncbi:PLAC8 family protein [Euphorbia peplus]|nr:PLAC8 family protein [Euphorbia peplus]
MGMEDEEESHEEETKLLKGMRVLDFDVLCSTVALQTQGKWRNHLERDDFDSGDVEIGGVFRMWEGGVLDCFDDHPIAIQSLCCPCYRFGKNMRRAGFGACFLQGSVYFIIALTALLNYIAFLVTRQHCFLYIAVGFTITTGMYLGFFRTQIRKKFNIRGTESSMDDFVYHIVCPCCALSQEARTLEINNVQDGMWHGRGDTICIGSITEGKKTIFELHPPPIVSTQSPEIFTIQCSSDVSDSENS